VDRQWGPGDADVRALYLNDQWEEYLEFRVEQEQARLYQRIAA
jgi:hypothetical protein